MNILIKLFLLTIALYVYLNHFMNNFGDRQYALNNKAFLFIYVFIIQFLINFISNIKGISNDENMSINDVIETSVNSALLAIIAYDIYGDLVYKKYYVGLSHQQQIMVLILLIIGFMATVKVLQLLISNN